MIAALRDRGVASDGLLHPGPQGLAQSVNLEPRIVDVELAGHLMACRFEKSGNGIAERRTPTVSDVKGAGWIRRNELHVDAFPSTGGRVAVAVSLLQDAFDHTRERRIRKPEVDEPRAGDRGLLDHAGRDVERVDDLRGERSGIFPRRFRQLKRNGSRQVAVRRIPRSLQANVRSRVAQRGDCRAQCLAEPIRSGQDLAPGSLDSDGVEGFFGLFAGPSAAGASGFVPLRL